MCSNASLLGALLVIGQLCVRRDTNSAMTTSELIAKAREHAAAFESGMPFEVRVSDFADVTARDAVIVHFHSDAREDRIKIYLDKDSGDFITAKYSLPPSKDA